MYHSTTVQNTFVSCNRTLQNLKIIIEKPIDPDRGYVDATLHRFKLSFELFLKLLKHSIAQQGKELRFPKEVLQEAYMAKLIDDEKIWLSMLDDRNQTSHAYNEELADTIYAHIKNSYYTMMQNTFDQLKKRFYTE